MVTRLTEGGSKTETTLATRSFSRPFSLSSTIPRNGPGAMSPRMRISASPFLSFSIASARAFRASGSSTHSISEAFFPRAFAHGDMASLDPMKMGATIPSDTASERAVKSIPAGTGATTIFFLPFAFASLRICSKFVIMMPHLP